MTKTFTGGARIGWVNATFPLATLGVSEDALELSAAFLGSYRFRPEDVVAVETVTYVPVLAWGVRIVHARTDIPARVIFWTFGPPWRVVENVLSTFSPRAPEGSRVDSKFPFRIPFVIVAVLLWNALLLGDRWLRPGIHVALPGPLTVLALALTFGSSLLIRRPGAFQRLALRTPESIAPLRGFVNLLSFVSGLLLIASAISVAIQ